MDIRHLLNLIFSALNAFNAAAFCALLMYILRRRRVGHRELIVQFAQYQASFAAQFAIIAFDIGVRNYGWGLTCIRGVTVFVGFRSLIKSVCSLPSVAQTLDETELLNQQRHDRADDQVMAQEAIALASRNSLSAGIEHLGLLQRQIGAK